MNDKIHLNRFLELKKRISDLEFKMILTDNIMIGHMNGLNKRISELENKYELNKKGIPETIHKYYDKNRTEIAELKEQIENIWSYLPSDLGEQLTELKGDLFQFEERIYTHGIIPRPLEKFDGKDKSDEKPLQ